MIKIIGNIIKFINILFCICFLTIANWIALVYCSFFQDLNSDIHTLFLPPLEAFGAFFIALPMFLIMKILICIIVPVNIFYFLIYFKNIWTYKTEVLKSIFNKLKQFVTFDKTIFQNIIKVLILIMLILEIIIVITFLILSIIFVFFVSNYGKEIFHFYFLN